VILLFYHPHSFLKYQQGHLEQFHAVISCCLSLLSASAENHPNPLSQSAPNYPTTTNSSFSPPTSLYGSSPVVPSCYSPSSFDDQSLSYSTPSSSPSSSHQKSALACARNAIEQALCSYGPFEPSNDSPTPIPTPTQASSFPCAPLFVALSYVVDYLREQNQDPLFLCGMRVLQMMSKSFPQFSELFSDFTTGLPTLRPAPPPQQQYPAAYTRASHGNLPIMITTEVAMSDSSYTTSTSEWVFSNQPTDEEIIPTDYNVVRIAKESAALSLRSMYGLPCGLSISRGDSIRALPSSPSSSPKSPPFMFLFEQPSSPRSPRSPRLGTCFSAASSNLSDVPPLFGPELSMMWQVNCKKL